MTVKNDLDAGVKNFTPATAPRTKTGLDGITALSVRAGRALLNRKFFRITARPARAALLATITSRF